MWKTVWLVTRRHEGNPVYSVWDTDTEANEWIAKYGGTVKAVNVPEDDYFEI